MAINSPIVSLAEVKAHLRYPSADTFDDAALQGFINAASDVIDYECNIVVPQQFEEYYDGGDFSIWLHHIPVISVENIQEGWGWTNYDLDYVQVNSAVSADMFAFSIDLPETGKISRRTGGNVNIPFMRGDGNIAVTYTAGRTSIPGAVRLAALELCAHWWQGSQQRSTGTANAYDLVNQDFPRSGADIYTPMNQAIPYRVIQLLKPFRRLPIIG